MARQVWFWILSLSVLWGGSFFFAKVAIGELGPLTVVFGRVGLAAIALNLLLAATGSSLFRGPPVDSVMDAGFWGEIACLAAALSYAFAGVYGRRFRAMGVTPMAAASQPPHANEATRVDTEPE